MNILKYMKLNWNRNEGFTLLEAIVSLLISSLTLLLLIGGINQVKVMNNSTIVQGQSLESTDQYIISDRQMEWHMFLIQLENHLNNSTFISLSNNQLKTTEWDENLKKDVIVIYSQTRTGRKNFRRSRSNGNHTLLTDIRQYKLTHEKERLYLDFEFKNGQRFKSEIQIESWLDLNEEENE